MTPKERAASISRRVTLGERLTPQIVAMEYGMTVNGSRRLLYDLCRVLPIILDNGEFVDINHLGEDDAQETGTPVQGKRL